jgi:hypothetical protein
MSIKNLARLCALLSILALSSLSITAQDAPESVKRTFLREPTPAVRPVEKKSLWRSYGPMFKASMTTCVGGSLADIASTSGLYESNPLFRRSDGRLNKVTAILSTGLVCGSTLLLERKYPRLASVMRFSFGGVRLAMAFRNWSK